MTHAYPCPLFKSVKAKDGKQPLLFVDENWREGPPLVHIFPPTEAAVEAVQSRSTSEIVFFLVDKVAGHVSGFVLGKEKYGDRFSYESIEIWRTAFPEASEKVAAVASRRAEEVQDFVMSSLHLQFCAVF